MAKIGDRVGALLGTKGKVVSFLGYGTYVEDAVPPPEVGGFNIGLPNPRIRLDNGKDVYGCEGWWGDEDAFRRNMYAYEQDGYVIETVDIDEARAAARQRDPVE